MQPPSGVVTFLLTDVEGSTELWERDEVAMDVALARHDDLMRTAISGHGGQVFSTAGDSFAAAFASPHEAVAAAIATQIALGEVGLRVRMAIHTGEAHERDGDYFGPTLNRAARLLAAAHGAQVVVSNVVAELLNEPALLRDLGEHRLRDLTSSTRIWQVVAPGLEQEFPPLSTLEAGRSNLPLQLTSLVGRDEVVQALASALDESRIVTVTGVGGIGKTRLALHAAAEALSMFPGGVWLALLGNVDVSGAVADVVLEAVGGRREGNRSPLTSLEELASARRLLVVLDNCEHLLDAAGEVAQAVVAGGQSVVLATSREPLGIAGEQVFPVPSLTGAAAITLFAERARAVDRSFGVNEHNRAAVSEICRSLDGMPLALELAAARARSMTAHEIARRLDARFRLLRAGAHGGVERHRTLQAAIQWSYDLLDADQRQVFDRLSVFAGGFTAGSAVAVCGPEVVDDVDAADVLDVLVARSMVTAERSQATTRYALLETLRQFGQDNLARGGGTEISRTRHAQHLLTVAEEARRQLSTANAAAAMDVFDNEWDNLRVAFEWFAGNDDVDGALRLIVASEWFAVQGCRYELLLWAQRAVGLSNAKGHELWPAAAGVAALLRAWTGDLRGSESLAAEALQVEVVQGVPRRFAPAYSLHLSLWNSGQTASAVDKLPAVERIAATSKDPLELGVARLARAVVFLVADPAGAGAFAQDAIRDAELTGNPHQLAWAHATALVLAAGRRDRAEAHAAYVQVGRWAEVARNRAVLHLAPVFLAMATPDDEPLETLSLIREVLVASVDSGVWADLDFPLRRVILPLVRLGQGRTAALLLGGMTSLTSATPDTQEVVPRAKAALGEQLGAELEPLLDDGARLTRTELAQLALDAIESCLDARLQR